MSLADFNHLTPAQQEALLDSPALKAPEGIMPNLTNPPNYNTLSYAVTIVAFTIATVFFLIRAYSRLIMSKIVHIEDALALLAFGSYIGMVWCTLRTIIVGGLLVHQWDITVRTLLDTLYPFYLFPLLYAFTLLLIKIAIIREWIRVFGSVGVRGTFFWVSWVVLILNVLFYTGSILALGMSCLPAAKFWNPWVDGRCYSPRSFEYASSIINLILDLTILSLPQRIIWNLNMSPKTKAGVSFVFGIGLLACAAALGRIILGVRLLNSNDRTFESGAPVLLALAEATGALLVFFIPAASKVFVHSIPFTALFHSLRSWTRIPIRNRSSESGGIAWGGVKHSNSCDNVGKQPDAQVHEMNANLVLASIPVAVYQKDSNQSTRSMLN
ncbi:hypothetical protein F4803DRAFT_555988 [Xylaria telfairii]|nr:hypothetical protein F4803DRAFT_555988 [Xylaria telfairii]